MTIILPPRLFLRRLFDPSMLSDLQLWVDAMDTATLTFGGGSAITDIVDKSPLNRGLVAVTANGTYVANGFNSLPTIEKAANGFYRISDRTGLGQNVGGVTVFLAHRYVAGTYAPNAMVVFTSTTVTTQTRFGMTPNPSTAPVDTLALAGRRLNGDGYQTCNSSTTRASVVGMPLIECGIINYSSAKASHWTNTILDLNECPFQTPGLTENIVSAEANLFGAVALGVATGHRISECIIYHGALSAIDREKVEGYLAWKWGLVSSLPPGHPYEFSPPYM
jgi:hypothetical protein